MITWLHYIKVRLLLMAINLCFNGRQQGMAWGAANILTSNLKMMSYDVPL